MRHRPSAVVFARIDNELRGDAAAARGLVELLGILDGYVPALFAASEQRGGRDKRSTFILPEQPDGQASTFDIYGSR